ncbi:enterotoxin A family protein [Streptomyces olivoreticuli]|uniref:scabin-related ADP-ribosyltransferase n=1 Tax=Streptomyces olivoreticuli TaxID=68246 RepID=UPI0026590850|nr:enterotoxin A family protein [Streptomyces olivoreticuli]WKK22262.1 enterotoxin A family protein [Streptomyces olivoreticuli]
MSTVTGKAPQATAASSAATLAEKEATVAQDAATQAKKDATDAGKLADSAEEHAKSAEEAAKNAGKYAREADEAAKKAEDYERELERKAREKAVRQDGKGGGSELTPEEEKKLGEFGISPEQYEEDRKLSDKTVEDYLTEIGSEILLKFIPLDEIKECIIKVDAVSCVTALIQLIPASKLAKAVWKLDELYTAAKRLLGIGKLLKKSADAKKRVKRTEEIIKEIRKKIPDCGVDSKRGKTGPSKPKRASFAGATPTIANGCDTVYRGDNRSPQEIESAGGFMPLDSNSKRTLLEYAEDSSVPSRFVGTSKYALTAVTFPLGVRHGGYVYEIKGAPGGIDVNATLGHASPSPFEAEIAFDGGIPWKYVTRIWKKDEFGEIDFDFDDPIWQG